MQTVLFLEDLHFNNKPQIKVMLETPLHKEIRICMRKGNTMKEHTAPGAITIMVIKGSVLIGSEGKERTLNDCDMVYFDAKIPHSLDALEESVIRLILSKNDSASRVQKLVGLQL